jgi:hypothetical protein
VHRRPGHSFRSLPGWASEVDWYNTRRLMEPLGYRTPDEVESEYYEALESRGSPDALKLNSLRQERGGSKTPVWVVASASYRGRFSVKN